MTEIGEKFIILLLGCKDTPLPSIWHLEKEMFIFSKVNPKINQIFNFEKHYNGPYSQLLQEITNEPFYFENPYAYNDDGSISLTRTGKDIFQNIVMSKKTDQFQTMLKSLELIREVYDKLTKNELLFLIYKTYPEYTEFSNIYDELVNNDIVRTKIVTGLLKKGLVTEERYKELLEA